jgi:L-fuconate dehydratase
VPTITGFRTVDVRFPTSRGLHGSDAMNQDPDYSAAYLILDTDDQNLSGHSLVFTIGRGNDLQCKAIELLANAAVGQDIARLSHSMGDFARSLVRDSQMRWLGPEKGLVHMATGAVINAVWDAISKWQGKPLWKTLADMSPLEVVDLVDFRYLTDALTPEQALEILERAAMTKAKNEADMLSNGVPAYTTTPGWLGYSDAEMVRLAKEAVSQGFGMIKIKCGVSLEDDIRRLLLIRKTVGPKIKVAVDANQVWDVPDAIAWLKALGDVDLHWVEEPTSPDDILGHATIARAISPIRVATGEHVANRVMFKQMMQAGSLSFVQLDASRVAGVNENVAILLLAAKFGLPVCPHAGGVGLCEMVQHLAMFDVVAVGGVQPERIVEFVDHLHEHFVVPAKIRYGSYLPPLEAGAGAQMLAASLAQYTFPTGPAWKTS